MYGRQPDVQGQVLGGRYRLETQLGSGGMAVVWSATDQVLGRTVAVKMLAGQHTTKPESLERIRVEARTAATLSHPNIAQVHDYGEAEEDGRVVPYVVMELLSGPTLAQRIAAGPMEPQVAFRICAEIAAALTAAHAASLVHRDIKPANVIVTAAGAKVVDFGIAASVSPSGDGDLPDQVLGTPSYLAPERLTDDAVEPASDVYALGVLLYKLLTGRLPWTVDTTTQVLTAHVFTEPAPLPSLPGVPDDVADLCHRCLRKDPSKRPDAPEVAAVLAAAAGLQVVADLSAFAATAPAVDGEPSAVLIPPRPVRHSLGRVAVVAGVGAVAVAAALIGAAMAAQPDTPGISGATPASAGVTPAPGAGATGTATGSAGTATGPGATGTAGTAGTAGGGVPSVGTGGSAGAGDPLPASDPPPTSDPPPPPPAEQYTLSSQGGSVRATCTDDGRAQLLSWTAAESYRVTKVEAGPASTAIIAFKHGKDAVRMSVTCSDGVPSATITTTTVTG